MLARRTRADRHGVSEVLICPTPVCACFGHIGHDPGEPSKPTEFGIPFHASCFQILRRVYALSGESVNLDGLWNLSAQTGHQGLKILWHERTHRIDLIVTDEPSGQELHRNYVLSHPLDESIYIDVWRGLARHGCFYDYCREDAPEVLVDEDDDDGFYEDFRPMADLDGSHIDRRYPASDKRQLVFSEDYYKDAEDFKPRRTYHRAGETDLYLMRQDRPHSTHIEKLPSEIRDIIQGHLCAGDIANARCAIFSWRELPMAYFRRLVSRKHPWLWEIFDAEQIWRKGGYSYLQTAVDWYKVHIALLKGPIIPLSLGLENRIRIWKDMENVKKHIAQLPKHTLCQPSIITGRSPRRRFPVNYWCRSHHGPRTCGGHNGDIEGGRELSALTLHDQVPAKFADFPPLPSNGLWPLEVFTFPYGGRID
jgi:hypothetical protein